MPDSAVISVERIDAELPQTQCGKCGHAGCRPYAEAIAEGEAINKCPPGGERTLQRLADLTGQPATPLERPAESPQVAVIREEECIGCTKCIQACPVDAILGAAKRMHTVIAGECTGCELCVAPCPVDCIDIVPHPDWLAAATPSAQDAFLARRAELGRHRHAARERRLAEQAEARRARRQAMRSNATAPRPAPERDTPNDAQTLKTTRATLTAAIKRLERQHRQADDARAGDIERRLAEYRERLATVERQLADGAAPAAAGQAHRRRMAINAAEQALRRARAQLAHAERQGDETAIVAAREQCEQARTMRDAAREERIAPSPGPGTS
ncbi:RnfABCDGE type electron transport complex subunit B [Modicisalibacter coralii]|uniref:RnfABCDGE type electron transport complex subunit B n=1 Tax=Modicisalibacter coralii TaxID=2304602 RepID=UPI001F2315D7|nr:RnfABCDGE type electron transport complex subunit B [Halomonas coralii]